MQQNATNQNKQQWGKQKLKKLATAFLTAIILLSPAGHFISQDQTATVEARGKKSFNSTSNSTNSPALFQKKKADSTSETKSTAPAKKKSSLMKGLMLGGLAGLLFGSLFAGMGFLGSILGLLVNVLAIVFMIAIIRKIFVYFKKKKEYSSPWRG